MPLITIIKLNLNWKGLQNAIKMSNCRKIVITSIMFDFYFHIYIRFLLHISYYKL